MGPSSRTSPCPSREELAALGLGTLSAEAWQAVAEHVQTCTDCSSVFESLSDSGDDLVGRLRELKGSGEPTFKEAGEVAGIEIEECTPPAEVQGMSYLPPGTHLREYRLLERIGEGGMGTVYRAVHTRLERLVALKVLGGERMHRPEALARFQREMKAVGKINHPNVVQATDAGETNGTHFLVMELVEGIDVSRLVQRRGPLPVADACELVRQASLGLANIHEHGLIHRDIKASNLILTGGGAVKILDLGLALLQERQQARASTTSSGMVMGSFDYMAPEQADNPHAVDARADLYSLGCTFFQLLTGQTPFPAPRYETPLQKMKAHESAAPPALRQLRDEVPREVEQIVARLLAKKPEQRFSSAGEVIAALQPFVADSSLAALAAQALGPTAIKNHERHGNKPDTQARASHPHQASSPRARRWLWTAVAVTVLAGVLLAVGAMLSRRELLERGPSDSGRESMPPQPPSARSVPADALRRQDIPEADLVRAGGGEREHAPKGLVAILKGHTEWVMTVEFSPDGKTLASGGRDNSIVLWDVATGKPRHKLDGHQEFVRQVAFSPDGKLLASASADKTIKLWDAESGTELHSLRGHDAVVHGLAFVDGKKQLASVGHDGLLKLWDLSDGHELASLPAHEKAIGGLGVSADGLWAASAGDDGTVKLWDLAQRKPALVMTDHGVPTSRVVFLPENRGLASGGKDGRILVWNRQGKSLGTLTGHHGWVLCLAAAASGKSLASSGLDGTVRLWDLTSMQPAWLDFRPFGRGVEAVTFSPDGGYVATGNPDGTVYVIRLDEPAAKTRAAK